jgi:hypothetical protein
MTDKPTYTKKYRVLKDFKDNAGRDHKVDEEIDLSPDEAQAHVNSGKITAELRQAQPGQSPGQTQGSKPSGGGGRE